MNKLLLFLICGALLQGLILWTALSIVPDDSSIQNAAKKMLSISKMTDKNQEQQDMMLNMISSLKARGGRHHSNSNTSVLFAVSKGDIRKVITTETSADCVPIMKIDQFSGAITSSTFLRVDLKASGASSVKNNVAADEEDWLDEDHHRAHNIPSNNNNIHSNNDNHNGNGLDRIDSALLVIAGNTSSSVFQFEHSGWIKNAKKHLIPKVSLKSIQPIMKRDARKFVPWEVGPALFLLALGSSGCRDEDSQLNKDTNNKIDDTGYKSTCGAMLYQFHSKFSHFHPRQHFPAIGMADAAFFEIFGEQFLCVAEYQGFVSVWVMDPKDGKFRELQRWSMDAASSCGFSHPDASQYLLLTSASVCGVSSVKVFGWNQGSRIFELKQVIPSAGTQHILPFSIPSDIRKSTQHFVFLSNRCHHGTTRLFSQLLLYRSSKFTELQRFYTDGAVNAAHFQSLSGAHYLAVANNGNYPHHHRDAYSSMYIYLDTVARFELVKNTRTVGAMGYAHAAINGTDFLAFSSEKPLTSQILACFKGIPNADDSRKDMSRQKPIAFSFQPEAGSYEGSVQVSIVPKDAASSSSEITEILYSIDRGGDATAPLQPYRGPVTITTIGTIVIHAVALINNQIQATASLTRYVLTPPPTIPRIRTSGPELEAFLAVTSDGAQQWHQFVAGGETYMILSSRRDKEFAGNAVVYRAKETSTKIVQHGLSMAIVQTLDVNGVDVHSDGQGLVILAAASVSEQRLISTYTWNGAELELKSWISERDLGTREVLPILKINSRVIAVVGSHGSRISIIGHHDGGGDLRLVQHLENVEAATSIAFDGQGKLMAVASALPHKSRIYLWDEIAADRFKTEPVVKDIGSVGPHWHVHSFELLDHRVFFFFTSPTDECTLLEATIQDLNKVQISTVQSLSIPGAVSTSHFWAGGGIGDFYLAIAVFTKKHRETQAASSIMLFNSAKNKLEEHQHLPTTGAVHLHAFTVSDRQYLAVAQESNQYNDDDMAAAAATTTTKVDSIIFRCKTGCGEL